MPEPVIYDAHQAIAASRATRKQTQERPQPVDPLRAFEIDTRNVFPEFVQWMALKEGDRLARVTSMATRPTAHRDLNYVIWRETQGVGGSEKVAIAALRRLFGKPDPKE